MTTPGWAEGWYFIPLANFVKPYQAMKEIWIATFRGGGNSGILLVWWLCWVFSGILDNISMKLEIDNMEDVVTGQRIDLASTILTVTAAVCLIKIITKITQKQDELIDDLARQSPTTD